MIGRANMWSMVCVGCLVVSISGLPASPLWAQQQSRVAVTTDTGDFAPGPRSYARYGTPLWCIAAAVDARDIARRTLTSQAAMDAVWENVAQDTLPAAAIAVAKSCGARFTMAEVMDAELSDLFSLSLLKGDDALADSVLVKIVEKEPTPGAKGQQWLWGLRTYLAAEPARIAAAESVVGRIDALPSVAESIQVQAHHVLLAFARDHLDLHVMEREAEHIIALAKITVDRSTVGALKDAYVSLMERAWLEHPDSAVIFAAHMREDFVRPAVQKSIAEYCKMVLKHPHDPDVCDVRASTPLENVVAILLNPSGMHPPRLATAIRADFWFPPAAVGGAVATVDDTVYPSRGHVTLVDHVNLRACMRYRGACREDFNRLRDLVARYTPSGLAVILLVDAPGYTILDVPDSSVNVAQNYRWVIQDYLKLPVTVAVRVMRTKLRMPAVDGRVFYDEASYTDEYSSHKLVLLDEQGRSVYDYGRYSPGGALIGSPLHGEAGRRLAVLLAHECSPVKTMTGAGKS